MMPREPDRMALLSNSTQRELPKSRQPIILGFLANIVMNCYGTSAGFRC